MRNDHIAIQETLINYKFLHKRRQGKWQSHMLRVETAFFVFSPIGLLTSLGEPPQPTSQLFNVELEFVFLCRVSVKLQGLITIWINKKIKNKSTCCISISSSRKFTQCMRQLPFFVFSFLFFIFYFLFLFSKKFGTSSNHTTKSST